MTWRFAVAYLIFFGGPHVWAVQSRDQVNKVVGKISNPARVGFSSFAGEGTA